MFMFCFYPGLLWPIIHSQPLRYQPARSSKTLAAIKLALSGQMIMSVSTLIHHVLSGLNSQSAYVKLRICHIDIHIARS